MTTNLPKSFDELIQTSDRPVFVDFWAEWCGPCKMVSPAVERIAREFKGKVLVIKINVDTHPHLAAKYQIQSIPTMMMFYQGNPTMRLVGALPYETIRQELMKALP